jgi:hypothetical protein
MLQPRRLTDRGIERFRSFIDSMSTEEAESFDPAVVNDPTYSRPVGSGDLVPEAVSFETRFEAAEHLAALVESAGLKEPDLDRGFWCWLSWVWFESLCPVAKDGRRQPRDMARWVLDLDWKRYYRHLLAGPWWVYEAHRDKPERAIALLCTSPTSPGELVEQVASRQELVSNPGLVEMITRLYYDPGSRKLKRGHGAKGPGSARRIADVADQLDMIWDLYSTSGEEFLTLLPSEFDKFQDAAA